MVLVEKLSERHKYCRIKVNAKRERERERESTCEKYLRGIKMQYYRKMLKDYMHRG